MKTTLNVKTFHVAGVQFRPADVIDPLESGQEIRLVAEPTNAYDPNAIRVEALNKEDGEDGNEHWDFIGYVPKKDTAIFHLLRQLNIKINLSMLVNHDANPTDMLLVNATAIGDNELPFI